MVNLVVEPNSPDWFQRFVLRLQAILNGFQPAIGQLGQYANDAAAEAAGVALYGLYWNGSAVVQRRA